MPRLCVACSPRPPAPPAEPPRCPRPRSSTPPSRPVDLGFEGKIQWPHRAHPPATRSEGSPNAHQGEHAALAGPRTPPSPSSSSTSRFPGFNIELKFDDNNMYHRKDLDCALQAMLQYRLISIRVSNHFGIFHSLATCKVYSLDLKAAGDRCKAGSDGNEYMAGFGGASGQNYHIPVEE
ncbi:hypothetical protein U9M48_002632 [Paspalum notatum var. saurae]|uniref:Uncharacterized protein n=1 Tax=Paspalum notatum var. saurae TaxID=547442 RepID=A0AAQ3SDL2_PASNO